MKTLLESATQRALNYLNAIQTRNVGATAEAIAKLRAFDQALPEQPTDPEEVLRKLDEVGSPATTGIAGPRYFGFVIGGSFPVAIASNWLATAWDQNAGLYNITPTAAHLEQVARRWLLDLLKLPPESGCGFVTGATVANFTALAAARHSVLKHVGWNVEADGLFGAPPITVVIGEEAHPTLIKSLGLLGLGRSRVVKVPVDAQGRMRADALPTLSGPTIVCAQVGNVNTGACDPVREICEQAHKTGGWVHVDGAFGLWASVAPSRAYLTEGIANADSWATDAHKWLNVPYDCGLAFAHDGEALRSAMAITAEYLPTETENRNPSDYTPELSRRARGVEVWAVLQSLGRSGVADLIERTCRHARRFAEGFSSAGYQILNEVVLNQVLVSFRDAKTTHQIISDIQKDGTCWCGGTVWQGKPAMRISVSSWATTNDDVEKSLQAMLRVAARHRGQ